MEFLSSAEGATATVAIVLEFVFRLVRTDKPLSLLVVIADGMEKVGKILVKGSELLDKVLPQKLK